MQLPSNMMLVKIWICLIILKGTFVSADYSSDVINLRTSLGFGDTSTFNPAVRPSATVHVTVGLTVLNIVELDEEDSTISLNGKLTLTWEMGSPWNSNSFSNIEVVYVKSDEMWMPTLVVENAAADNGVISDNKVSKVESSGRRTWEPFFHTKVLCDIDLSYFPFDQHRCRLAIASSTYLPSEVFFNLSDPAVSLNEYLSSNMWDLDPVVEATVLNQTTSVVTYYFTLTRLTDHLRIVLFLPLVFLSLLSLMVFVLPPENGQKAYYCVTILLTIVVFVAFVQTYIPVSKNLPWMVIYTWVVFIMAALCIVCACFVLYIYQTDPSKKVSCITSAVALCLSYVTCNRNTYISCQDTEDVDEETAVKRPVAENNVPKDNDESKPETPKTQFPPVGGVGGSLENGHVLSTRQLPPLSPHLPKLKNNKVRPKSHTSVTSVKSINPEDKRRNQLTRKHLASSLDRLFFILFLLANIVVHSIFSTIISAGS